MVLLNRLITLCKSGLWYVNMIHFFLCVCMGVLYVFCVLIILFLKLRIVCNGKPLFIAMVQIVFHPCCLACSVISVDSILFMQKLYAVSLCSNGWLYVKCIQGFTENPHRQTLLCTNEPNPFYALANITKHVTQLDKLSDTVRTGQVRQQHQHTGESVIK